MLDGTRNEGDSKEPPNKAGPNQEGHCHRPGHDLKPSDLLPAKWYSSDVHANDEQGKREGEEVCLRAGLKPGQPYHEQECDRK
jgi:hypothetical protein